MKGYPKKDPKKAKLADELSALWAELEEIMGEQAAYQVACERLGIDPDDGYSLLWHSPKSVPCKEHK